MTVGIQAAVPRSADQPLLVRSIGAKGNAGRADLCALYPNHPRLNGRAAVTDRRIAAASKQPFAVSVYVKPRVPSLEIYGVTEKGDRVILVEDHASRREREGAEARALIDLTESLCNETPREN